MSGVPVVLTIAPGAGSVSGVVAAASLDRDAPAAPAARLQTIAALVANSNTGLVQKRTGAGATTVINSEIILSNVRGPAINGASDETDGQNALVGRTARNGLPLHTAVQKRP